MTDLTVLEEQLRDLSHGSQALELIQAFAKGVGKTKTRQVVFGADGALVRSPINYREVLEKGLIEEGDDPFSLLQGDIVRTDAAFLMGERISGAKFAVASSTCDLVQGRRKHACLLVLRPIGAENPHAKQLLGEMLKFTSTQRMYLPPLPGDEPNILANSVVFDGLVQVSLEDLLLSTRLASLSLVGWRIFGSLVRSILVRTGANEVKMRESVRDS